MLDEQTDVQGGTVQTPKWTAQLPDDLKAHEALTSFATVGDLGKAYIEAHGKLKQSVPLLPENATAEQKAEFYERLGRPRTPEQYDLPEAEELADWRQQFHALGLTNAQAKGLYEAYMARVQAHEEARGKALAEVEQTLKRDWGGAYDANLELARRAVVQFGGDELKAALDESGLGNDLRVVKAFAAIGKAVGEDAAVGSEGAERTEVTPDGVMEYANSPKLK